MRITKEVRVALLVLLAIVLLIFGYNFLKGKNLLSDDKVFYALYDNVEGLDTSSKVTINGLIVGKVLDIDFADESGKLKVTFNVENKFKFGKNSIAKIYSPGTGLIGGKNIKIITIDTPDEIAVGGEVLSSKVELDMIDKFSGRLDPIQVKLNSVLDKTDIMIASINKMLNEENVTNISKSIKALHNTLESIQVSSNQVQSLIVSNKSKLGTTIDNFKQSSDNINKFSKELSEAQVSKLVADLDKTVNNFSSIAEKLDKGNGTAGKLINDSKVYDNLNKATHQLDQLLQDMKLNPKRYIHFSVFGKKNKEYNAPEDPLK